MGFIDSWNRLRDGGKPSRRWLSEEKWHDVLEPRILLDATPAVVITGPEGSEMVGEQVSFNVNFTNDGDVDSGFLPFVDLIVPTNGADGAAGTDIPDGLSLLDATFQGQTLSPTTIVVDGSGSVTHPFATDDSGNPLVITGLTPGDTFVTFQFPFGSVAPGQTFDAVLTFDISNLADVDTPLVFEARGGFSLGEDALENPSTDPPIIDPFSFGGSVDPTLFEVTKTSLPSETETATGPNFVRQFEIAVDIANGQTLTDLDITDYLGPDLVFVGVDSIEAPGGTTSTVLDTPVAGQPNLQSDNDLRIRFDTVTGTAGADEIVVTFSYYVNDVTAGPGLNPVIDPNTGDETTTTNPTSDPTPPPGPLVQGTWNPIDPRDSAEVVSGTDTADIIQRSIAIQKSVANINDPQGTGLSTGDTLEYTLEVQISDFFTFGDLVITDLLGDGQSFDTSFAPTLAFNEHSFSTTGSAGLVSSEFSAGIDDAQGTETITFQLSDAVARLSGDDGILEGGRVGGSFSGTTATLVFRSVVDPAFIDPPADSDPSVSQGDILVNNVTIAGTIRDNANISSIVGNEDDGSASSIEAPIGSLTKGLYAINGTIGAAPSNLQVGDTITYRLTYDLPLTEFEDLTIVDFLPQPILDALELDGSVFDTTVGPAAPAAGSATFGPSDTFFGLTGITPGIAADDTTNTVTFDFGTFDGTQDTQTTIDILFTVEIQDASFADQLPLTNQASAFEDTTNNGDTASTEIVQVTLASPDLSIRKGIVTTDNSAGTFGSAIAPAGITFNDPGVGGAHFSGGSITSDNLGATIDSDLSNVDAGDLVKFAVVVENIGADDAFDVIINDLLPAGYAIPTTGLGLNLQVTDGNGNTIALEPGADLFGAGIELADINPGADIGAIDDVNGAAGANIIVITYDLVLEDAVAPEDVLSSDVTIDQFTAREGGLDRSTDPTDSANTTIAAPSLNKATISTSFVGTGSGQGDATFEDLSIGETVTFRVIADLSEGTYSSLQIIDDLPVTADGGILEFVSGSVESIGAGVAVGSSTVTSNDTDADSRDDRVVFDFGNTVVTGDNTANNTVSVLVTARLVDVPANAGVETLTNTATVTYPNGTVVASASIDVVEPSLQVAKDADVSTGDAGDTVNYTVRVTHTSASSTDAFGLTLTDLLVAASPGITLNPGSVSVASSGASNVMLVNNAGPIEVTADSLALGGFIEVTYSGTIDAGISPNTSLTNNASVGWSGLPDGHPDEAFERSGSDADSNTILTSGPTLVKSVFSTSIPGTGSGEFTAADDLAIGELVTFELAATVPEGTTDLVITDDLPFMNGVLEVVSSEVFSIGGNATAGATSGGGISVANLSVGAAGLASDINLADGSNDRVVFDFGTVDNAGNNVAGDDTIVVRVVARVTDVAANVAGDTLVNLGTLDFTTATGSAQVTDSESVDIVEPSLTIDTVVDQPTVGDAGDVVTYTVTITHDAGSSADAFDLTIADLLDPDLVLLPGTVTVVGGNGAVITTGNGATDTTVRVDATSLDLGTTLTIMYQAAPADSIQIGQTVTNTATLDWDNTTGVGGRAGSDSDDAMVTVSAIPSLDKTIVATSVPETGSTQFTSADDLVIGELVTFDLTATLTEGTTNLILTDDMPFSNGVLEIVSSEVFSIGGNTTSGATSGGGLSVGNLSVGDSGLESDSNLVDGFNDRVVFDFGTVVNAGNNMAGDDTIVVRVVARVVDIPENSAGDTLVSPGTMDYTTAAGSDQLTDSESVDIVEPELLISKSADRTDVVGGELIDYSVTISHEAGSTAPAFDLVIADVLNDPLITLVSGSVTASAGSIVTGNGSGDNEIRVDLPTLGLGSTITVTYQVQVVANPPLSTTITNNATVDWDSLSGVGGRSDASGATEQIRTEPDFDKAIVSTSISNTLGSELTIGELATYHITVTLGEGDTPLVVNDDLPDLFTVVSSRVVSIGGNTVVGSTAGGGLSGSSLAVGDAGVASDANFVDGQNDRVVFDFGTVSNAFDASVDGGDVIVVEVVGRVEDVAGNVGGNLDSNVAVLDFGTDVKEAGASTTLVEPELQIDKASSSNQGDAGDTLTFTLTIDHTTASTADAFDIVIEDLLSDSNLALVDGSVAVSSAPGSSSVVIQAGNGGEGFLRFAIDQLVEGGQIVIEYQAQVLVSAEPQDLVDNTATVTWDSAPGVGGRADSDSDTETFLVDEPTFNKFISSTSDSNSEFDQFNIDIEDVFPEEEISFDLVVRLPEGTNTTVIISDLLPPGFDFISSEVVFLGENISVSPGGPSVGVSGTEIDSDMDGSIDTVVFDFTATGPVVNLVDQQNTVDDEIHVRIVGEAPDVDAGLLFTNNATYNFGTGVLTDSVDFEIGRLFSFDLFNSFGATFGGQFGQPGAFAGEAGRGDGGGRLLFRPVAPLLPLDPIYSGTAEPGSSLNVTILNAQGMPIATSTAIVDAGGNWQLGFPSSSLVQSTFDATLSDRLVGSRLFNSPARLLNGDSGLFGMGRGISSATHGTVLYDAPHTIRIEQIAPNVGTLPLSGDSDRTFFTPPINQGVWIEQPLSVSKVMGERPTKVVEVMKEAAEAPLGSGANKFTSEFVTDSGSPSGK